jgi:NTP pyrophosphatase (non-canonical NTP hydrolase)
MDLNDYQSAALETSHFGQANNPQTAIAPMLGLAGATGKILDLSKKYFRRQVKLNEHRDYLREKLGDLLWYVAVVAKSLSINRSITSEAFSGESYSSSHHENRLSSG